jgi:hypothetical protein
VHAHAAVRSSASAGYALVATGTASASVAASLFGDVNESRTRIQMRIAVISPGSSGIGVDESG